ncbi:MAG: hypothetical protein OEV61_05780 [Chloroflexota bacterium]|nr:hypothetical protein [Chloroflexota bacterium]MDH5242610.1 hypothetical protein [Chloroflexota bacterium]
MADLDIHLDASVDLDELEGAILRARASELSEIRRRDVRLTTGYGDATTREGMDDEARRARLRYEALSQLLTALRAARSDTPLGSG